MEENKKTELQTGAEASASNTSAAGSAEQKNPPERSTSRGKKNKKKWKRWVALAVVAVIVIAAVARGRRGRQNMGTYLEDTVSKRDIQTSLSFTGTVEAENSQDLSTTVSGVKVLKVNYEKGDTVKKGDVIATLDSSTVEDQIAQSEATLAKTKEQGSEQVEQAQSNYDNLKTTTANGTNGTLSSASNSLKSAQKSYNDLKSNVDNGLESSIQQARTQMETAQTNYDNLKNDIEKNLNASLQQAQNQMNQAFQSLTQAQNNYNNEVSLNNQQLSQTILTAQSQVTSAYNQVTSAQTALAQAQENRNQAEEHYNDGDSTGTSGVHTYKGTRISNDYTSYDQAVTSAQNQLNSAQSSYTTAKQSYEAAKQNEENSLTQLYDNLLSAQTSYLAAVDSYNATVNQLNEELAQDATTLRNAVDSYNAAVNAVNQQLSTSAQQVEQASDSLAAAKASNDQQLESYAQQVEQAKTSADTTTSELQLQQLKDSLDDYEITAPIDGELSALDLKEGEIISAGTSIGTVTDFSTMKIEIKISEYDIEGISKGTPVTVSLDAISDKTYDGTISYISHQATVSSGVSYFEADVEFKADDDARSGMSAEVKVITADDKDVLAVPNDAIQTDADGSSYVLVKGSDSSDSMSKQTVETGATDGSYTEIKSGLSEGDTIYYQQAVSNDLQSMMMGGGMQGGGRGGDGGNGGPGGGDGGPQ